jgi:hypothetical protein
VEAGITQGIPIIPMLFIRARKVDRLPSYMREFAFCQTWTGRSRDCGVHFDFLFARSTTLKLARETFTSFLTLFDREEAEIFIRRLSQLPREFDSCKTTVAHHMHC